MEFKIDRSDLIKRLSHVDGIVENRNTIPILSNVMIKAEDGKLTITTTDLDITAQEVISGPTVDVVSEGSTTLPMGLLSSIVRKTPEGSQIHFLLGASNRMEIRAGRARFAVPTLSSDEFPQPKVENLQGRFTLTTEAMESAIRRVQAAISTEETRYYLNGVFLALENGILKAVATDGHRLSVAQVTVNDMPEGLPNVIIPRKAIREMLKLTGSMDGEIEMEVNERAMSFVLGDVRLQSKLIDGTFPDYNRVIPQGDGVKIKIHADELSRCLDRVSTVSAERTRAVKVNIEKDWIKLAVTSPETGTATEEVPCQSSGDIQIGFNARYLIELLSGYGKDEVTIELLSETSPAKFTTADRPHDINILMPMRI